MYFFFFNNVFNRWCYLSKIKWKYSWHSRFHIIHFSGYPWKGTKHGNLTPLLNLLFFVIKVVPFFFSIFGLTRIVIACMYLIHKSTIFYHLHFRFLFTAYKKWIKEKKAKLIYSYLFYQPLRDLYGQNFSEIFSCN